MDKIPLSFTVESVMHATENREKNKNNNHKLLKNKSGISTVWVMVFLPSSPPPGWLFSLLLRKSGGAFSPLPSFWVFPTSSVWCAGAFLLFLLQGDARGGVALTLFFVNLTPQETK